MTASKIKFQICNRLIFIVFFNVLFIGNQVQAIEIDENLFPIPENIKPSIRFWVNAYTLYNSNQIIIHDSENLEIIYEVIDLTEKLNSEVVTEKEKWEEAEKVKQKYRKILLELAKQPEINPARLNSQQRYVYNLFHPDINPQTFRAAANNIRGQQGLRNFFREGLARSGRYAKHLEEIFKKYDLPLELTALPFVESLFNYRAYSKVGAAGIWQFTRKTGRRFLKINYTVDERFDPVKSTEAAAKLLKENYEALGSWPLAITAYNHGVYGMKRAVERLKTKDFGKIIEKYKSRSFKFASKNFYAEFLAACEVSHNYKIYFGDIKFAPPLEYIVIKVPGYVYLSSLAKKLNISIEEIKEYNPALRKSVFLSRRRLPKGYELKLPYRKGFDPAIAYAQIAKIEKFDRQITSHWYKVRQGDNLEKIARRFSTTVSDLLTLNNIENANQIYIGQVIRIKPEGKPFDNKKSTQNLKIAEAATNRQTRLKTSKMASDRGGQGEVPINPTNQFQNGSTIEPTMSVHQKNKSSANQSKALTFEVKSSFSKKTYDTISVQPGETLGHYADWLKIPTQELRRLNGLRYGQPIQVNQKIKLVFRNVSEQEFQQRRLEFHRMIEEDFFSTYRIDGFKLHRVKPGDNIWQLGNDVYNIPYWLIRKYNPDQDLHNLKAGDILIMPNIELKDDQASE